MFLSGTDGHDFRLRKYDCAVVCYGLLVEMEVILGYEIINLQLCVIACSSYSCKIIKIF